MNILYISQLSGQLSTGLFWSVTAGVQAQAKIDNVFWLNLSDASSTYWEDIDAFHQLKEFGRFDLSLLPTPFNNPDLVVFEGIYQFSYYKIAKVLWKKEIPYIIVPHCSLTEPAQKKKGLKKFLGNMLIFNKLVKRASAIHYLTNDECANSKSSWNKNHVIIPNGISSKDKQKTFDSFQDSIRGLYIGRMDPYHKGLDLLVAACEKSAEVMRSNSFTITLHGPEWEGEKERLIEKIKQKKLDDILIFKNEIFGEEKEKALLNGDVFIMTSRFEGHPMGLIEALSYGLPCSVTEGTNMASEIAQYDAGWTSKTSVDGIVSSLKQVILDKSKFKEKGENARALSLQYDWFVIAQKTSEEYGKFVNL